MQLTQWSKCYAAENTEACLEYQVVMVVWQPQARLILQTTVWVRSVLYPLHSVLRHIESAVIVIHSDPKLICQRTNLPLKFLTPATNAKCAVSDCDITNIYIHTHTQIYLSSFLSKWMHLRFVQGDNSIDCIILGVCLCLADFSNWSIKNSHRCKNRPKTTTMCASFWPETDILQTSWSQEFFFGETKAEGHFHQDQYLTERSVQPSGLMPSSNGTCEVMFLTAKLWFTSWKHCC